MFRALFRRYAVPVLVLAALAGAAGVGVVGLGAYDVAATEPHWRATAWVLDTAMRSSVRQRARGIDVPPGLDARSSAEGAAIYAAHCAACHGAPGVAPEPFALGLVPPPANLAHAARSWPPRELYWVISNGVRMTGMPAWEYRLSPEQIWSVVAFLPRLAGLTPAQYAALGAPPDPGDAAADLVRRAPDPERGRRAVNQYGCATCHHLPGAGAATAPVGPSLRGIARRTYIAGGLPNTPENMTAWLLDPPAVNPGTAMPNLRLRPADAQDIAAWLATLD